MNESYLLLGGNLGNVIDTFEKCEQLLLEKVGLILKKSSDYESPSWGFVDENKFINRVVCLTTTLPPKELLKSCLEIEKKLGRKRNDNFDGYSSRVLDIDILFYNNITMEDRKLCIPHQKLHLRRFTLLPLHELNPDLLHPKFKKSIQYLLDNCNDKSEVIKL